MAPRDGSNYIPQVIRYATGMDLVECTIKATMGEEIYVNTEIQFNGCWAYYAVHSFKEGFLKRIKIDSSVKEKI